jgi:hypothetical protein
MIIIEKTHIDTILNELRPYQKLETGKFFIPSSYDIEAGYYTRRQEEFIGENVGGGYTLNFSQELLFSIRSDRWDEKYRPHNEKGFEIGFPVSFELIGDKTHISSRKEFSDESQQELMYSSLAQVVVCLYDPESDGGSNKIAEGIYGEIEWINQPFLHNPTRLFVDAQISLFAGEIIAKYEHLVKGLVTIENYLGEIRHNFD